MLHHCVLAALLQDPLALAVHCALRLQRVVLLQDLNAEVKSLLVRAEHCWQRFS